VTATGRDTGRRLATHAAALAAGVLALLFFAPPALAAPPILWEPDRCPMGKAAGQCEQPRGVAASPITGRVFIGDNFNSRVVEFDALGGFVKAWGWDVVASGPGDDAIAPEDEFEVCVPEDGDVCQAGTTGGGAGQFNGGVLGVEVDAAGDIHVVDRNHRRVQKFSRSGEFLLMYGGEVNKTTGADVCTHADLEAGEVCGAGTTGSGPGEFGAWAVGDFIALGADDRLYVGDAGRIQRFGADGVYQAECATPASVANVQSLAGDAAGSLYAIANNGPEVLELSFVAGGECEASTSFVIPPPAPSATPRPTAVAVDVSGRVYAFSNLAQLAEVQFDRIFAFDAAGNVVDQFGKGEFSASTGMATNLCPGSEQPGNLYVTTFGSNSFVRAYGTEPIGCFNARTQPATEVEETSARLNGTVDPGGAVTADCRFEWGTTAAYGNVAPCAESPAQIGDGSEPVPVHADISGLAAATTYHFRLRAEINGETETGPDEEFKTKGPPAISDEHLVRATADEALVKALVNPEGFPTSCRVDYGTGEAFDQSTAAVPVGEDRSEHPLSVVLEGLQPGTTYEWRFVCENSAILDGGLTVGEGGSLTTPGAFAPDPNCPNAALRGGYSAALPDCRAYEMVSPVDKTGADIVAGPALEGSDIAGYAQAAPGGDDITYAAKFPAFADPSNSFAFNQYLARRQAGSGWSSEGIHPPYLGNPSSPAFPVGINRDFISFTPDLCSAWLVDYQTPPLNPDGQSQAANLYRRENCGPEAGGFETLTDAPLPLEGEPRSFYVDRDSVQGHSDDGRHAIFIAKAKLTEDANEGTNAQLYDRFEGKLHLVSVLPGGVADPANAMVGSGWHGNLEGAVSEDGSRVYWTSAAGSAQTGQIYLRLQEEQETIEVSEELTGLPLDDAFFWAASPDGSKALYSEGEDLHQFDLASGNSQLVAGSVMGVAGASEDLTRVYFVSRAVLPGSGANSEEGEAVAGEPNLYLAEGGELAFVGTLAEGDVGQLEPGAAGGAFAYDLIAKETVYRATRVTPDGSRIAFNSRAPLTGFDNAVEGGRPAVEVFTYEAGADELLCASCNPSGARPQARELPEPYRLFGTSRVTKVLAAAWIPTWEHPTHATNVLSEDGNRLFFNSNDALLPRDTNGTQDVYEWEAPGTGGCDAQDSNYFARSGGCVYLISSGDSPFESIFWEASASGDDVFFTTESSLLPQDPGSVDLYDARVGGGFPQPADPSECEGEACQSPPPAPAFSTPNSAAYRGPGNAGPQPPKRRCRKGKRVVRKGGKVRCLEKKGARKQGKRRANRNRRTSR